VLTLTAHMRYLAHLPGAYALGSTGLAPDLFAEGI